LKICGDFCEWMSKLPLKKEKIFEK
jgi:hypothetical protein